MTADTQPREGVISPANRPAYRILVCLYSWYYFRQMRPALEILARQGHRLHIIAIMHDRDDFQSGCEELCTRYTNVTFQVGPERGDDWTVWAEFLRTTQCFLQSQEPRFDNACRIADRKRLAGFPLIFDWALFKRMPARELAWRFLRRCNAALPTDPKIDAVFLSFKPDVMIITPLLDRSGQMWDYMASARARGVHSVFPVHSWDNLSSKARVNVFPDRMLVWNQIQRDEAIRFHRVPKDRIAITGAQGFDDWFEMQPSTTRSEFCSALGLNPEKPILLFVCSAILKRHMASEVATSKTELPFFTRWIGALRKSTDARLREANVIIRPHPKREDHWDDVDLTQWGRVVVHPSQGRLPNNDESKAVFFDSLYHSEVIIGLNTSAMIEAGIVGRPVMTVLDPDYRAGQIEMQHFQYLLNVAGGLLIAGRDYAEHMQQLAALFEDPEQGRRRAREFTSAFVRPLGLGLPAAPIFAEIIAEVAARSSGRPHRSGAVDRLLLAGMRLARSAAMRRRKSRWGGERLVVDKTSPASGQASESGQ